MSIITKGDLGSYKVGNDRYYGDTEASVAANPLKTDFIPNDFVGLNTNVIHDVDITGESAELSNVDVTTTGMIDNVIKDGMLLNAVLLSRNGPYGYSTWRQLDFHSNHKVSRALRQSNIISYDDDKQLDYTGLGGRLDDKYKYHETPISTTSDGVVHEIVPLIEKDGEFIEGDVVRVKSSYGNDIVLFDNESLNTRNGISSNNIKPISYGIVAQLYTNIQDVAVKPTEENSEEVTYDGNPKQVVENKKVLKQQLNGINGKFKLKRLIFSETVFPKRLNMYQSKTRTRDNFEDVAGLGDYGYDKVDYRTFWHNEFTDRLRTDTVALNSQGIVQDTTIANYDGHLKNDLLNSNKLPLDVSLSSWPLDTSMQSVAFMMETDSSGIYDYTLFNKIDLQSENITFSGFSGFINDPVRCTDLKRCNVSGTPSTDLVAFAFSSGSGSSYVGVGSYIQLDLGEEQHVRYIALWGRSGTTFSSTNFPTLKVQYSDDALLWSDAITGWNPRIGLRNLSEKINSGSHRYWRLYVTTAATSYVPPIPSGESGEFYELEVFSEKSGCSKYSIPNDITSGEYGELGTVKKYIDKDATESYGDFGDYAYHIYAQNPGLGYTVMGNYLPEVFSHYLANMTKYINLYWMWDEFSNFELKYNIPYQTSKKPWYDSYNDYSSDLIHLSKSYSILSEYNMSDFVDKYVLNGVMGKSSNTLIKESDGALIEGIDYEPDFLKVLGSDLDSLDNEFNDRYVYSDVSKQLRDIKAKNNGVADIKKIKLKIDTINKPIPKRGFYPVDRSMQIGSLLKESYGDVIESLPINMTDKLHSSMLSSSGIPVFSASNFVLYNPAATPLQLYSGTGASVGDYFQIDYGKPVYVNRFTMYHSTALAGYWTGDVTFDIQYSDNSTDFYSAVKNWNFTGGPSTIEYSDYFDVGAHQYWRVVVSGADATSSDTLVISRLGIWAKPYLGYNGLQTFLYHLMSPGVFYNSIKSGIAVSLPAYVGTGNDFNEYDASSNESDTNNNIGFSVGYDATYASSDRTDSGTNQINQYECVSIYTPPNSKISFEALLNVGDNVLSSDITNRWSDLNYYFDPQPYFNYVEADSSNVPNTPTTALSMNFTIDSRKRALPYFEMSNNNFLGESERFFLRNKEMTSFISRPDNEFKAMEYGTVYYMDVVLKNRNIVMTEGYLSKTQYGLDQSGYEQYYLKQRGSIYGYPLNGYISQTSSSSEEHIQDLRDPHYGQWTPPYFYGDSVARISFAPHEFDTTMSPGQSRKFTLDEILRGAKIRTYKKTRIGGTDGNGNFVPSWDDDIEDRNGLYNTVDYNEYGIESVDSATYGEFASTILFSDMMTIDSSVNLWSKKKAPLVNYKKLGSGNDNANKSNIGVGENGSTGSESWVISTKWESPILQFSGHGIDTYCSLPDASSKELSDVRRARGMWYDYGILPSNDDGIYLELKEFPGEIV